MPKRAPHAPTNSKNASASNSDTYVTTIDLPGETVRGWRSSNKIKVVLRKHRDVLFDIRLFKGMTYTVHAEKSPFYNVQQKKIVMKGKKITFQDGERIHLWIGREFKGALVLKANDKILGRYEPSRLDPAVHDSVPMTKPAPLLVLLHNPTSTTTSPGIESKARSSPTMPLNSIWGNSPTAAWAEAQVPKMDYPTAEHRDANHSTMHIIEIRHEDPNLPREIANFFKTGGEQTALDTNGQITRNWLIGTIIGGAAYYDDNKHWIKELWKEKFYIQRVNHRTAGPKWYIVFRGNPQTRQFFTAARYGVSSSKVLAITSGAGSIAGLRHGAWDAAKGSLKKAGGFAVLFTMALDTAEWLSDYEERDPKTGQRKKDFFDLVLKLGIDLAKAGLSAVLGAVAMGALVFLGVITGGAAVVVGAIVLSVAIGLTIDWLDKKTGATDSLNRLLRDGAAYLEKKMPTDYGNYDGALQQAIAYGGMGA